MSLELGALNLPIRATGRDQVLAVFRQIEQEAAKVGQQGTIPISTPGAAAATAQVKALTAQFAQLAEVGTVPVTIPGIGEAIAEVGALEAGLRTARAVAVDLPVALPGIEAAIGEVETLGQTLQAVQAAGTVPIAVSGITEAQASLERLQAQLRELVTTGAVPIDMVGINAAMHNTARLAQQLEALKPAGVIPISTPGAEAAQAEAQAVAATLEAAAGAGVIPITTPGAEAAQGRIASLGAALDATTAMGAIPITTPGLDPAMAGVTTLRSMFADLQKQGVLPITTPGLDRAAAGVANVKQQFAALTAEVNAFTAGVARASTAAASMEKLRSIQAAIQAALASGNLTLAQRIELETQLARVEAALAIGARTVRETELTAALEAGNLSLRERIVLERELRATQQAAAAGGAAALAGAGGLRGLAAKAGPTALLALLAVEPLKRATKAVFEFGTSSEEAASKFRTTFGTATDSVDEFLQAWAPMAGLNQTIARDFTATIGAVIQGLGATRAESAKVSEQVLRLAGDLASFNNRPIQEAFGALRSGITGEMEPLKRLGIVVSQVEAETRALGMTGKRSASDLTVLEIATARLALIMERAGVSVGDLERTQDSAANKARKLGAVWQDLQTELSEFAAPGLEAAVDLLTVAVTAAEKAVSFLQEHEGLLSAIARGIARTAETVVPALSPVLEYMRQRRREVEEGTAVELEGLAVTGQSTKALAEEADILAKALQLQTATTAERQRAIAVLAELRARRQNDAIALEERNLAEEKARDLTVALTGATGDLEKAEAQRVRTLVALASLTTLTTNETSDLRDELDRVKSALQAENLERGRKLELLRQERDLTEALARQTRQPGLGVRGTFQAAPVQPAPLQPLGEMTFGPGPARPMGVGGGFDLEQFNSDMDEMAQAADTKLQATFDRIQTGFDQRAFDLARDLSQTLAYGLTDALVNGLEAGFEALFETGSIGEGFRAFTAAMLGGLGDMLVRFGTQALLASQLIQKIMSSLARLNPAGAIAASIALIAVGAALKAAAKSIFGGAGGGAGGATAVAGTAGFESRATDVVIGPTAGPFFDPRQTQPSTGPATEAIIRTAQIAASTLPTPAPAQTFNFTVIGERDPVAQRQITNLIANAQARGY